jgi:hypothetical protein
VRARSIHPFWLGFPSPFRFLTSAEGSTFSSLGTNSNQLIAGRVKRFGNLKQQIGNADWQKLPSMRAEDFTDMSVLARRAHREGFNPLPPNAETA